MHRNWTLVVGCSAFLLVGIIATLTGASIQTATFRAVVASCVGGICGFLLDYFVAQSPVLPAPGSRSSSHETEDGRDPADGDGTS